LNVTRYYIDKFSLDIPCIDIYLPYFKIAPLIINFARKAFGFSRLVRDFPRTRFARLENPHSYNQKIEYFLYQLCLHERGFSGRAKRVPGKSRVRREMSKTFRAICNESYQYYGYQGQYEFTFAPLGYYERQKIKFRLRNNDELDKLDNYNFIKINNTYVTKYVTRISLENNQLTNLPPIIYKLKSLTLLNLVNNQLTKLLSAMRNLKSLIHLYISNNQLTTLPSSMDNLKSLKYLYIIGNQLTEERIFYIRNLLPNCFVYSGF